MYYMAAAGAHGRMVARDYGMIMKTKNALRVIGADFNIKELIGMECWHHATRNSPGNGNEVFLLIVQIPVRVTSVLGISNLQVSKDREILEIFPYSEYALIMMI